MATTENSSGFLTLPCLAALGTAVRVKLDTAGKAAIAAATDAAIGVTCHSTGAAGDPVTVKLFSAPGTFLMTASVAITVGTQVFPAASGKIAATGTTALNLVAKEPASADGDIIECVPVYKGA